MTDLIELLSRPHLTSPRVRRARESDPKCPPAAVQKQEKREKQQQKSKHQWPGTRSSNQMYRWILILLQFLNCISHTLASADITVPDPKFSAAIANATVPVGREGVLTCLVQDLGSYKVAWLRVDTQTILTIQNHVITKNHRIGIGYTEKRIWQLRIKDVKETDRGWYMCQINSDPMKSQVGHLEVVVPPDILDDFTSQDMIVSEGNNVTLKCAAVGQPEPAIIWRRERGKPLLSVGSKEIFTAEGSTLAIPRVNRHHMGAYLCIASNGVPPTVSKRMMLIVNFPPTISVRHQSYLIGLGQKVTLECITESYPNSVNYWLHNDNENEIVQGGTMEETIIENVCKVVMKLTIRPTKLADFGTYKCVAKNSLGEAEEIVTVDHKPRVDLLAFYQANNLIGGAMGVNRSEREDWKTAAANLLDINSTSTAALGHAQFMWGILFICLRWMMLSEASS